MDVVLGVAVTGPVARLALVGAGTDGSDVIDQSVVDLANNPVEQLTETVVGTNRLLANENHRLVGTRVCWTDHPAADQLRQALEDSGVHNVGLLSQSQAVTALMRAAGRSGGVLVVDDNTATLSVVGEGDPDAPPTMLAQEALAGDAAGTLDTMMAQLGGHPDAPSDVYLVGAGPDLAGVAGQLSDATTRVRIPEDPTFALARGAALAAAPVSGDATAMAPAAALTGDETAMAPAAGLTGDETAMAPAGFDDPGAADQQLAYSLADDADDLLPGELDEFDDYYDDDPNAETGPLKLSRRSLLVGNAVVAFAVIGVASLAVAVVVAVRPTASQQPVIGHQNAAPGKFMPLLPTQQQAPVPPPPPEAPNAGYQGGFIPAPAVAPAPAAPAAPVPVNPVAPGPGLVPNPNGPIPIPVPIIVPFPGWRPQPPPYVPPYTPPTTPTLPTTTTTPTNTPTTTQNTPTTTVAPTTAPSTTVPSTTVAPTTVPSTTVAPSTVAPTTVAPSTVAPTTVAPTKQPTQQPTQQQQTVAPKPPTQQQQTVAPKPPTVQQTAPKPVVPRLPSGGGGSGSGSGRSSSGF
ncbi:hypothetical protein [Mycobacterium simiae]|uniref:hypothetical protein n=1 Tax=Mycobacterium simiae TaxID=1784 RepID=UPI0005C94D57|nr:hypothetical protein [Mycobacterium simiae]PLV54186.1 hypothetical protein X011_04155 [Mycobacterium tuberculosis variant microti OV254]BBX40260.1 hypothetical protein MSIM_17110 [Mycobacterium simiae]